MRSVSDGFLAMLRASHSLWVEVDACAPGSTPLRLPVSAGTVTLDRTADARGRVDLRVNDPALFPRRARDALAPYGTELNVRRGVRDPAGVIEVVSLGWFRVEDVTLDVSTGELAVTGRDRMAQVADERFTAPYAPTGRPRHVDLITTLIRQVHPGNPVSLPTTGTAATARVGKPVFDIERYEAVRDLAAAVGCDAYFDGDGTLVVAAKPAIARASEPVWDADAGPTGVLTGGESKLGREGVYNGVVARGENPDDRRAPVQALVVDNRPGSPTRWGGPFGRVPRFYVSSLMTTTAQCQAAARGLLQDATGLDHAVTATCVPNPALEPGDVVRVVWPDGTAELKIVESVTIPLVATDTMTLTARAAEELPANLEAAA